MTHSELSLSIANVHAYHRGYWDGIQFSYIPDYNTDEMKAWSLGFQQGKKGSGITYLEDLEQALQDLLGKK